MSAHLKTLHPNQKRKFIYRAPEFTFEDQIAPDGSIITPSNQENEEASSEQVREKSQAGTAAGTKDKDANADEDDMPVLESVDDSLPPPEAESDMPALKIINVESNSRVWSERRKTDHAYVVPIPGEQTTERQDKADNEGDKTQSAGEPGEPAKQGSKGGDRKDDDNYMYLCKYCDGRPFISTNDKPVLHHQTEKHPGKPLHLVRKRRQFECPLCPPGSIQTNAVKMKAHYLKEHPATPCKVKDMILLQNKENAEVALCIVDYCFSFFGTDTAGQMARNIHMEADHPGVAPGQLIYTSGEKKRKTPERMPYVAGRTGRFGANSEKMEIIPFREEFIYECRYCSQDTFLTRKQPNIRRHITTAHPGQKYLYRKKMRDLMCAICKAVDVRGSMRKIRRHLTEKHPNQQPMVIDVLSRFQRRQCYFRLCSVEGCEYLLPANLPKSRVEGHMSDMHGCSYSEGRDEGHTSPQVEDVDSHSATESINEGDNVEDADAVSSLSSPSDEDDVPEWEPPSMIWKCGYCQWDSTSLVRLRAHQTSDHPDLEPKYNQVLRTQKKGAKTSPEGTKKAKPAAKPKAAKRQSVERDSSAGDSLPADSEVKGQEARSSHEGDTADPVADEEGTKLTEEAAKSAVAAVTVLSTAKERRRSPVKMMSLLKPLVKPASLASKPSAGNKVKLEDRDVICITDDTEKDASKSPKSTGVERKGGQDADTSLEMSTTDTSLSDKLIPPPLDESVTSEAVPSSEATVIDSEDERPAIVRGYQCPECDFVHRQGPKPVKKHWLQEHKDSTATKLAILDLIKMHTKQKNKHLYMCKYPNCFFVAKVESNLATDIEHVMIHGRRGLPCPLAVNTDTDEPSERSLRAKQEIDYNLDHAARLAEGGVIEPRQKSETPKAKHDTSGTNESRTKSEILKPKPDSTEAKPKSEASEAQVDTNKTICDDNSKEPVTVPDSTKDLVSDDLTKDHIDSAGKDKMGKAQMSKDEEDEKEEVEDKDPGRSPAARNRDAEKMLRGRSPGRSPGRKSDRPKVLTEWLGPEGKKIQIPIYQRGGKGILKNITLKKGWGPVGPYWCKYCSGTIEDLLEMRRHMLKKHRDKVAMCTDMKAKALKKVCLLYLCKEPGCLYFVRRALALDYHLELDHGIQIIQPEGMDLQARVVSDEEDNDDEDEPLAAAVARSKPDRKRTREPVSSESDNIVKRNRPSFAPGEDEVAERATADSENDLTKEILEKLQPDKPYTKSTPVKPYATAKSTKPAKYSEEVYEPMAPSATPSIPATVETVEYNVFEFPWQCYHCAKSFPTLPKLKSHLQDDHCTIYHVGFDLLAKHHKRPYYIYLCTARDCTYTANSLSVYLTHEHLSETQRLLIGKWSRRFKGNGKKKPTGTAGQGQGEAHNDGSATSSQPETVSSTNTFIAPSEAAHADSDISQPVTPTVTEVTEEVEPWEISAAATTPTSPKPTDKPKAKKRRWSKTYGSDDDVEYKPNRSLRKRTKVARTPDKPVKTYIRNTKDLRPEYKKLNTITAIDAAQTYECMQQRFWCLRCTFRSTLMAEAKRHLLSEHPDLETFKVYDHKQKIRHKRTTMYLCKEPTCGIVSFTPVSPTKHVCPMINLEAEVGAVLSDDEGPAEYECTFCGVRLSSKAKIEAHMLDLHASLGGYRVVDEEGDEASTTKDDEDDSASVDDTSSTITQDENTSSTVTSIPQLSIHKKSFVSSQGRGRERGVTTTGHKGKQPAESRPGIFSKFQEEMDTAHPKCSLVGPSKGTFGTEKVTGSEKETMEEQHKEDTLSKGTDEKKKDKKESDGDEGSGSGSDEDGSGTDSGSDEEEEAKTGSKDAQGKSIAATRQVELENKSDQQAEKVKTGEKEEGSDSESSGNKSSSNDSDSDSDKDDSDDEEDNESNESSLEEGEIEESDDEKKSRNKLQVEKSNKTPSPLPPQLTPPHDLGSLPKRSELSPRSSRPPTLTTADLYDDISDSDAPNLATDWQGEYPGGQGKGGNEGAQEGWARNILTEDSADLDFSHLTQ